MKLGLGSGARGLGISSLSMSSLAISQDSQRKTSLERLAIVLTGSLGDVARGMALPAAIKKQLPSARIAWVVDPRWAPYVSLNSCVDEVITLPKQWNLPAWRAGLGALRSFGPQVTFDLQRILKSSAVCLASGAKIRIGFHPFDAKECSWFANNTFVPRFGEMRSKLEVYLEFLKAAGLSIPETLDFGLSEIDHSRTLEELRNRIALAVFPDQESKTTVIVFGTAWQSKEWNPEGYRSLISILDSRTDRPLILVGDKKWRRFAEEQVNARRPASRNKIISLVGQTTLPELVSLLAQAAVVIGPDSGPGHVAASVGTKYVSLFGPTRPARTAPFGSEELAVSARIGCAPCYRKICPGLGNLCMRLVEPEAVYERMAQVTSSGR